MDQYGDIVPGIWNIPEPALTCKEWSPEMWTGIDWVVVPGLAFDRRGAGSATAEAIMTALPYR